MSDSTAYIITTAISAIAIVGSLAAVIIQVRATGTQNKDSRQAEQVASAFFDLYEGWAQNRRAQVAPIDEGLLRTSAAQCYTAAFRLNALVDDGVLDDLNKFMKGGLGDMGRTEESFDALWNLHCTVGNNLDYRKQKIDEHDAEAKERFRKRFWPHNRNVPDLFIGTIDEALVVDELKRARGLAAGPTLP